MERATGVSPTALRVLKALALIGLLKETRLPATCEILQLAITDAGAQADAVGPALEELETRRLVQHSRFRGTYRISEGGDVDVDEELALARRTLPGDPVMRVARVLCPPPRLVARRHSYETGAVRVVGVSACDPDGMPAALDQAGDALTVVMCLAPNATGTAEATLLARASAKPSILVGIATETDILRDAARDVAAAHELPRRVPDLQNDRAARLQLAARRHDAESAFRAEWERLFGAQTGVATWLYAGEERAVRGSREFSELLSRMADRTYPAAPRLRNELLNRHALSSSAAMGRRSLIEAMLTHASEERLGIQGFPPQASMYECVLEAPGLHRRTDGAWGFGPPEGADPSCLGAAWARLSSIVFADPLGPRPVTDVFAALSGPPLGVTAGVAPVLLCAFLLANEGRTTLYRDGSFVPEPSVADWEVLLRRPELFAVAGCQVTGDRLAIVKRLAAGLGTTEDVLPIVRVLYRILKQLPDHARRTRRLPEEAMRLREAFGRARVPETLLFVDLPAALGVELPQGQASDPARVEGFFRALNSALRDLNQALPTAVDGSLSALLSACGLPPAPDGLRRLRADAAGIEPLVTNPVLVPFVRRAAVPGDDASVVDSVLAYVADKPPHTWTDADLDRCHSRARQLGELFRQAAAEASVTEEGSIGPEDEPMAQQAVQALQTALSGCNPRYAARGRSPFVSCVCQATRAPASSSCVRRART